jgi:fatty acid desaturase
VENRREGSSVETTYRERLAARRADAERLDRRHATLAWVRLGIFFVAVALVFVFGRTSAPWLALPILAFVPLLFVHARVLNGRDRSTRAAAFYERGCARLTHAWQGSGERGERYRNPDHLYADDLDLFGAGGLFELLVTTRTRGGEDVLAAWLMAPAPPLTIVERQAAVAELAAKLDLREDLAVIGPELEATVRTEDLRAWAVAPSVLQQTWPRLVLPLASAISVALIGQWIATGSPPDALLLALGAQFLLSLRFRHAAHHVAHGIEAREQELRVLATIMARIEREPVDAPRLQALRDRLRATGRSPAEEVHRLARLIDILSSGHNQIFAPLSALLLLGTQLAFAVERWRMRCGPAVPEWLAAVAEYEALSALSTYAAEHSDHPFPEVRDGMTSFVAENLAHPLLPADAVPNDVRLGDPAPQLMLVSGSNMSGKSTLLRTVGLNAVLAQAGAPVRATRLEMSPLRIGATLRIQDSLQAGRSRFYAEISRISAVVALTAASTSDPDRSTPDPARATSDPGSSTPDPGSSTSDPGTLFLFDELLAGTNSHDRLAGATGILRGLLDRGAIGLATTHDLALTAMVEGLGGRAVNVHFEDRFEHGTLTFDYRLKPGVVRTSNAIALMRAVGLDV